MKKDAFTVTSADFDAPNTLVFDINNSIKTQGYTPGKPIKDTLASFIAQSTKSLPRKTQKTK